ncbi:MAG: IPT/TIG domain-containing protein [Candidatus Xenobiia bacterium LiM19]
MTKKTLQLLGVFVLIIAFSLNGCGSTGQEFFNYGTGSSESATSTTPAVKGITNLNSPGNAARTGDWIQIDGSAFGVAQGGGNVKCTFDNSTSANATLFNKWNDTQIICQVPQAPAKGSGFEARAMAGVLVITDTGYSSSQSSIDYNPTPNPTPTTTPPSPSPSPSSSVSPSPSPSISPSPSPSISPSPSPSISPSPSPSPTSSVANPVVTSVSSATIYEGQTLTIKGSGFGSSKDGGESFVYFEPATETGISGFPTTYTSWTDTEIVCVVPQLTVGDTVWVRVCRFIDPDALWSEVTAASTVTVTAAP